jgi:ADP-heptose:LPS heptosyltransferase
MFEEIKKKIESNRGSRNIFWKFFVFLKDFTFWRGFPAVEKMKFFVFRGLYKLGFTPRLTVRDYYGFGDTIMTGSLCEIIKNKFKGIKINCITHSPDLLKFNPNIDTINGKKTFFWLYFNNDYLVNFKHASKNLFEVVLGKLGIKNYGYKSKVYLSAEELEGAKKLLENVPRPILTFCTQATRPDKTLPGSTNPKEWPQEKWRELVKMLAKKYSLVHLGDQREPEFENVIHFAGKLSKRESMAVLGMADMHVGIVSFLMHAANGLGVPSVIIYGGRETPESSGYQENKNIYSKIPCSPCWLFDARQCPYNLKCMEMITPGMVFKKVLELENEQKNKI